MQPSVSGTLLCTLTEKMQQVGKFHDAVSEPNDSLTISSRMAYSRAISDPLVHHPQPINSSVLPWSQCCHGIPSTSCTSLKCTSYKGQPINLQAQEIMKAITFRENKNTEPSVTEGRWFYLWARKPL